jgi:nucleotide-binding universal stress UspA family protein
MTIRRILVGLDGSPLAETVLGTVRAVAMPLGADVLLLHVTHVPHPMREPAYRPAVSDVVARERVHATAYLDAVARDLGRGGLTVRIATAAGEVAEEIVRHAEREHADLIALATHGRSGIRRWLHGSVAEAVLHATRTPLLLLPPAAAAAPPTAIARLVVPVDGSTVAEAALPLATVVARSLGVPILLLRVVEPLDVVFAGDPVGSPFVDYVAILERRREEAADATGRLMDTLREAGVSADVDVDTGSPVDVIVARSREAGTLTVMTTHGRSGWRALLGSITRRVVPLAGGPVLVVPPPR